MEPWWQLTLIIVGSVVVGLFLLYRIVLLWASSAYKRLVSNNAVSVDAFVGGPPTSQSALKVLCLHHFNTSGFRPSPTVVPLEAVKSDKVPGLWVTQKKTTTTSNDDGSATSSTSVKRTPPPLVVGTIRMGFGHHRIAYAATSWGLDGDTKDTTGTEQRHTYFHDLLNIDSPEANQIHSVDQKYSRGSRWASEMGGFVEALWGSITKSGDEDSLRVTYQWGEMLRSILQDLDRDSPIVATHSLVANAAVACGFRNVINLVIDNHAQWFVVVPGALNLVQGPSNYHNFLRMGVEPSSLQLAGHWIPRQLVEGLEETCRRRIQRAQADKLQQPLRILIPVGGAGAQRKFIVNLVRALAPLVRNGKVRLFLNAGDHEHMKASFLSVLTETTLEYDTVTDMKGVLHFKDELKKLQVDSSSSVPPKQQQRKAVTLFTYDDYFTAVATTDILAEVSDVLACKPSELAFYPIPKLMIRRVGDHEAYSALRASELGDGTLEARTLDECLKYVRLFLEVPDLLTTMNTAIINNNKIGVYDGCKNAMRIALERAEALK